MNVNEYLLLNKEMYEGRHFSETVRKARYQKAFEIFKKPEKKESLDDIIGQKREEYNHYKEELLRVDEILEQDIDFHVYTDEEWEQQYQYEELDYGFER